MRGGWTLLLALVVAAGLVAPTRAAEGLVDGYGRDRAAAERVAQDNARVRVLALLREQLGPDWRPTEFSLDPDDMLHRGVLVPVGETRQTETEGWRAQYKVVLTDDLLRQAHSAAWHHRVESRRWLALRGLMMLLSVTGLTAGYLRLESLTRGYYTRALRVTAVLLAGVAAAGLWLSI